MSRKQVIHVLSEMSDIYREHARAFNVPLNVCVCVKDTHQLSQENLRPEQACFVFIFLGKQTDPDENLILSCQFAFQNGSAFH